MDKLVLIDGNSLLNRAFYATPIFTTRDGKPTNAIFGFVKLLFKIIDTVNPEYLVVAFDLKAPTFRHKMFTEYKATRKPMPLELADQIEPLKSLLSAMNIAMCQQEGIEADDIVGTLSKRFDVHSFVITGDRDSYQLVDEKTDVYFTKKGVSDLLKLSNANFKEEVGIEPKQIIDLKALMGDKSDNIPGVAGVGEKTALELINTYGTLDNVYAHIDDIKGALQNKLINGREQAYLSYTLATINRDCDLDVDLSKCAAPRKYSQEVKELFTSFEFKSLLALDIFDEPQNQSTKTEYDYPQKILVESQMLDNLFSDDGEYFIDFDESGAEIYHGGKQYSIKLSLDLLSGISYDDYLRAINAITANPKNHIVLYDYKKFLHTFKPDGINVECNVDDLSVIKYLADFFDDSTSLGMLCEYHGYDKAFSAFALNQLFQKFYAELEKNDAVNLYRDVEKPLINVLYDMEYAGVKIDALELDKFEKNYTEILSSLKDKIYTQCGATFNINSPSQLGDVLFVKLGLKSGKKNKSGKYSTSADILEKLAEENEVVRDILRYRSYQKLYSTYIEGIKQLIDKRSNLVHTTYNQTATITGRLSSTNPNLQNIPIREEEGRELRKLFIPKNGNVLIDADYSQIELRLLAHFSECKELIDAYNSGADIHALTASQVFGVPIMEVTPKMRREAKAVNFGIIYGISDFGLSRNLNISVKTAREYIENYFKTYSAVKDYMLSNVEFAKQHGYVSTLIGRKRFIREINSSNYNLRQFGERAAMNMPLQGSSADIIKIAMINVANALKKAGLNAKLILQVHDELVLDCPQDEAEEAGKILKYEMENAVKLKVPLEVDVHSGKNWYEAK